MISYIHSNALSMASFVWSLKGLRGIKHGYRLKRFINVAGKRLADIEYGEILKAVKQ